MLKLVFEMERKEWKIYMQKAWIGDIYNQFSKHYSVHAIINHVNECKCFGPGSLGGCENIN